MPRNTGLHVLLVAALLVLAGCGGAGTDTVDTEDDSQNATPLAPGVAHDAGTVDTDALLSAHRQTLNESGFTYRFTNRRTYLLEYPDEPTRETVDIATRGRVAAESGLTPYLVNETDDSTDPPTVTVAYLDADGGTERVARGQNVTVDAFSDEPTVLLAEHYLVGNLLSQGNWTVSERREDALVLEAGPDWSELEVETIRETNISTRSYFDGELVVSRDGRIERLTVNRTEVERIRENGELHSSETTIRRFEYELLETDSTQVERPTWAGAARNGTTTDE